MHAYLDVNGNVSPQLYVGRLSGTAAVKEHVHESSWEVLGDVKGTGTLTIDGAPTKVNPGDVVFIPPNTKHAWTPDAGQELQAVQLYYPPGPEQRFKALAAKDDAKAPAQDAGAVK
jgi:mannose-6-phosphate isomerase-like protein (cupin superfamily)